MLLSKKGDVGGWSHRGDEKLGQKEGLESVVEKEYEYCLQHRYCIVAVSTSAADKSVGSGR